MSEGMIWFSDDKRRMASGEMALYEFTHINEDGVYQYRLVGLAEDEEAEKFLDGEPAQYVKVTHAPEDVLWVAEYSPDHKQFHYEPAESRAKKNRACLKGETPLSRWVFIGLFTTGLEAAGFCQWLEGQLK